MPEAIDSEAVLAAHPTYLERWWRINAKPFAWILLAGTLVCHLLIFWINRGGIAAGSYDFVAFYSAAQVVKSGLGESLYSIETQRQFQQEFPSFRDHPLLFNHPPFELPVYLPLAYLPFSTAFLLWTALNLAALSATLLLLFPYLQDLRKSLSSGLVAMLMFSFFPVLIVLVQGQDSLLFLLFYVLTFVSLRRGQERWAGLFAALCLFRFQLMIPLLVALGIRRRWKVLSGFLVGLAGLGVVSILVTGWRGTLAYPGFLAQINQAARNDPANKALYYIHPEAMPNLRGFFDAHLAGRIPDGFLMLLIAGLSFLLFTWSLSKGIGSNFNASALADLPFALHTTVILLISYHMHLHDVSILLLPLLLVANHLAGIPGRLSRGRLGLSLLVVLLFLSPPYFLATQLQYLNLLALPLVVFALLIGFEISRGTRSVSASV